ELPIQSDRAHEGRTGDLIVPDVVDLDPAGVGVAQDHVGFARHAAEIAEAHNSPIHADVAQEGGVGDVVVADVVDLKSTRRAVAQQNVGGGGPIEAAETNKLPIGSGLAQLIACQDRIVPNVVDFVSTVGSAQDHVGRGSGRRRRVRGDSNEAVVASAVSQRTY